MSNNNPQYRDCLIVAKQINEKTISALGNAYELFIRSAKDYITNRENLDTSRSYTQAAIKANKEGKIDNKHVQAYLEELIKKDKRLDTLAKDLEISLEKIRNEFVKERRAISELNLQHVHDIKDSKTAADNITLGLVDLGNRINKMAGERIPAFMEDVRSMIKKIEREIVDEAFAAYNNIIKLDKRTFNKIERRPWTDTDYNQSLKAGSQA